MSERTDRLLHALRAATQSGPLAITGHDAPDADSVVCCALLGELCAFWGVPARIALTSRADEQARRMLPGLGVDPDALRGEIALGDAVALVDHHAPLHGGCVAAVIDHHPTANPPEAAYVQIEPCGACALLLLRLTQEAGMPPSDRRTALAVTALYADTLALRSAKASPEEAAWAREQADALGLDVGMLEREGLGLDDLSRPDGELALIGLKTYDFDGVLVASSSITAAQPDPARLGALLRAVLEQLRARGAALWVLVWQDPFAGATAEYDVTPDGDVTVRRYDRLVSRGQEIMPRVERTLARGKG